MRLWRRRPVCRMSVGVLLAFRSWSTTYVAQANVLNQLRVEVALADDLLEDLEHQAIERSVLEAALLGLGQGSTDGECDDNIVGVLGSAVGVVSQRHRRCTFIIMVIQSIWGKLWRGVLGCVHLLEWGLARGDVGEDVGETLGGHCESGVDVDMEGSEGCGVDWGDAGITILLS